MFWVFVILATMIIGGWMVTIQGIFRLEQRIVELEKETTEVSNATE